MLELKHFSLGFNKSGHIFTKVSTISYSEKKNKIIYRFDVCVGSGQKFSLRAPSTAERQTWLIALGTCKQAENEQRNSIRTKKRVGKMDKLQRKSTELRLYCDLLVQQVCPQKIRINLTSTRFART